MKLKRYQSYLEETLIPLRLACIDGGGWPLVVSLWYLYQDGALYCATQADAKVVTYLQQNPRCGYEVAADVPPYCGVRGRATAEILPAEGETVLRRLLERYLGGVDNELALKLLKKRNAEVAVRLTPETAHAWNFTDRMNTTVGAASKPCPNR